MRNFFYDFAQRPSQRYTSFIQKVESKQYQIHTHAHTQNSIKLYLNDISTTTLMSIKSRSIIFKCYYDIYEKRI